MKDKVLVLKPSITKNNTSFIEENNFKRLMVRLGVHIVSYSTELHDTTHVVSVVFYVPAFYEPCFFSRGVGGIRSSMMNHEDIILIFKNRLQEKLSEVYGNTLKLLVYYTNERRTIEFWDEETHDTALHEYTLHHDEYLTEVERSFFKAFSFS